MILIPTVSIGNVPQLALDLLLHTYPFKLEKTLDDEFMYPIAGPLDYASTPQQGLGTPVQVFADGNIRIVQLRSPPLPNCVGKFLHLLRQELGDDEVLVVGSANAGMRLGSIDDPKLTEIDYTEATHVQEAGFFLDALKTFKCKGLLLYTYEGDNIHNAVEVAANLVDRLGLEQTPLREPISWKRMYGKDTPVAVEDGIYA